MIRRARDGWCVRGDFVEKADFTMTDEEFLDGTK